MCSVQYRPLAACPPTLIKRSPKIPTDRNQVGSLLSTLVRPTSSVAAGFYSNSYDLVGLQYAGEV
jgi:hypothetical protein